ncbi:Peripherin-2 [Blomia tropicalis]|nr:Peripherin-2 [Blomia tropicalis]
MTLFNFIIALIATIINSYFIQSLWRILDSEFAQTFNQTFIQLIPEINLVFLITSLIFNSGGIYLSRILNVNRQRLIAISNGFVSVFIYLMAFFVIFMLINIFVLMVMIFTNEKVFATTIKDVITQKPSGTANNSISDRVHILARLQTRHQCCGANGFTDWSESYIWKNKFRDCAPIGEPMAFPYIPPSCCNPESTHTCYQFVPKRFFKSSAKSSNSTFYHFILMHNHFLRGCAPTFAENLFLSMTGMFIMWTIIWALDVVNLIYLGNCTGYSIGCMNIHPNYKKIDILKIAADPQQLKSWWIYINGKPGFWLNHDVLQVTNSRQKQSGRTEISTERTHYLILHFGVSPPLQVDQLKTMVI